MPHQTQTAQLRPMTASDIETLIALGQRIWQEHYVPIIGQDQVAYMTSQRFTLEYLSRYLDAHGSETSSDTSSDTSSETSKTCWLELLQAEGATVGYCSYSLGPEPHELKLEQLYLLPELHGRGLGGLMLRHIESHARSLVLSTIWLTVNKYNAGSIAVYRRSGFTIREEAVFDIGNGFVMDDYVMEKQL